MSSSGTGFSLSQYEETKQRMKQLQLEQQQQKKIAAAAAATLAAAATTQTPVAQESKESSTAASARPRTDRTHSLGRDSVTQQAGKSSATARVSSASSTRDASTVRSTPAMHRVSSARSTLPGSSPSALSRVPSTSSYSPLSPRSASGGGTNIAWNPVSAASSVASAIAVNHAVGPTPAMVSPRSQRPGTLQIGGDSNENTLQGTAPFPVSSVIGSPRANSANASASSTPRHSAATAAVTNDPFQAHVQPVPAIPSSLLLSPRSLGDQSRFNTAFASKLESLSTLLASTAQSLGLKYSLDAKLKQAVHELETVHNQSLRASQEQLREMKESWMRAQADMMAAQQRYQQEILTCKTILLEKQRKLDRTHAASLARAIKEQESILRGEYAEKSKRFEGIEKYNQEKLKQLEEQLRVQLKQSMQAESKASKKTELALQEKLDQLESQGIQIVQEKDQQLEELRNKLNAAEARMKEVQQRTQTWEKKVDRLNGEKQKQGEELNLLRIELAQSKQDNLSLLSKLDRQKNESLSQERDSTEQASKLANRLMDLQSENEAFKRQTEQLEQSIAHIQAQHEQSQSIQKAKHVQELDTIQSRITAVLHKKDEQIAQLKGKLQEQLNRVKEIERELGGI